MNLIEHLGSYEAAKEYLANLEKIPMHEQTEDTLYWLPDMLLQYRREHDIYEPLDKVVLVGGGTTNVLLEIIDYKYTNDLYRVRVLSTGSMGPLHRDNMQHATPEEIKAGRRL